MLFLYFMYVIKQANSFFFVDDLLNMVLILLCLILSWISLISNYLPYLVLFFLIFGHLGECLANSQHWKRECLGIFNI